MKLSHPFLYLFVLACSLFVIAVSLGELLWGTAPGTEQHWTEKMFFGICHQLPDRTYSVNGQYMSVNTRCFGIFTGIAIGWMLIPFINKFTVGNRWPVLLLLAAVLLQIADYVGNMIELWQNTNHSRAFLGSLAGLAIPVSLSDLFYKRQSKL
ncbi:hypothetical protein BH23BAC3_BH23BAC3_23880 [soil metagenome]